MRTLMVTVLFSCSVMACGGDGDPRSGSGCTVCDAAPGAGTDAGSDACVCLDGGTDSSVDAAPFTCDPVAQTGCPVGKACYSDLYNDPQGLVGLTYSCATPGTGTDAASCASDANCAAGFWCVKSGINKCTAYCGTGSFCPTHSPTCTYDQFHTYPFGYCACINPPGIGTCP
jgi:hypothetical protein